MGESPRRSVRTAVQLRDLIGSTLAAVAIAAEHVSSEEAVELNPHINRVMLAIDEYADHLRHTWELNHPVPAISTMRSGPSLTYVHTDGATMTAVDHAPVCSNPRERAISRALIQEALRLLEDTP